MRTPGRYKVTRGDLAVVPEAADAEYAEVIWLDVEGSAVRDLAQTVEIRVVFRTKEGVVLATIYGSPPGRMAALPM